MIMDTETEKIIKISTFYTLETLKCDKYIFVLKNNIYIYIYI